MPLIASAAVPLNAGPYFGLYAEQVGLYIGGAVALLVLVIYIIAKLRALPHETRAKLNPTMDPMQVEELMHGNPPIVVDLRSPEEFAGKLGHLRGAVNIPFHDLKHRIDEVRGTTGNRPIVLVDKDDRLSHIAVPIFRYEGFEWLYVLKGGMKAWARQKLPVYR